MSQLEDLLIDQIAQAGLPFPVRQFQFAPPRRWKSDFAWVRKKVICEVEGGTWLGKVGGHTSGKGYEANCEKYNECSLQGWTLIRVTGTMVKDGRAIGLLRRALEREPVKWITVHGGGPVGALTQQAINEYRSGADVGLEEYASGGECAKSE